MEPVPRRHVGAHVHELEGEEGEDGVEVEEDGAEDEEEEAEEKGVAEIDDDGLCSCSLFTE